MSVPSDLFTGDLSLLQVEISNHQATTPLSLIYHGLPACRIGSINIVLHTAARLVVRMPQFGQVTEYMWDELHWLFYPHRIAYRISALVRRCIEGLAPPFLRELCCSTA